MSDVFADLLTSAYATGGSLLKFGGDALLLLFDGADHPTRAATTAMRMRTALADRGAIKTEGGGTIRLRMSVGVHTGDVHFFRVGDSHKELLVTGPAASAVCSMESAASAGQILVSPETAALIHPALVGEALGPGFLLKRRRADTDAAGYPQIAPTNADLRAAIPVALRDALLTGVEPEHRLATIAFVHFDGIDSYLATHGAAETGTALDELVCAVQAAADDESVTFLGSDLDHDGGKLILVGGAPRALGDDEGRVLRTVRKIVDAQTRLPVRVGVNRGHVFVGEVGPPYRRTYTVMGDTVNLAARLMAKAVSGEIISTTDVLDNARTLFETTAIPPFFVKGKTAPINAFLVGPAQGRRRRAGSDLLPFVGRSTEFDALLELWDDALAGRGGVVAVYGDAGIGKSRLVREFTTNAPGMRSVTAYCETYQATTPYFAARYLLRGALGIDTHDPTLAQLQDVVDRHAPELAPWLPLVAAVVDVDAPTTPEVEALEPQFRRARAAQVVVDLFTAVVTEPLALVVDDAHWLDELSGELLLALAAAAKAHPWLVVLAGRLEVESYAPPEDALDLALNLDPLDQGAASALLTSAEQTARMRPDQRDAIIQRSGGNPLFLEQLVARGDGRADELPDSLETLVAAEIDALPGADRHVLRLAAVLGPIFDTDLLLELAGETDQNRILTVGVSRFLEPVGSTSLRFRNQTYRDVAYETLSFGRRRELHERALAAIESGAEEPDDFAEVLSFHALHARDFERCWKYSMSAGDEAESSYALIEAATLYERALVAAAHPGVAERSAVATTWIKLGDVSLDSGIYERAKRSYDKARLFTDDDPVTQAHLCRKQAATAMHLGQAPAVTRWLNRGLNLVATATDTDAVLARSELRVSYAEMLQRRRRNSEAMTWADLARDDALDIGNKPALAKAYAVLGLAAMDMGDFSQVHYLEEALHIWEAEGRRHNEATMASVLGAAAYYTGQWDDAAEYFERSRSGFERAGDVVNAGYGTSNMADILLDQGRGADTEAGLYEVIGMWRSVGHPDPIPGALVNIGRCALERGDLEEARARFTEARGLTAATAGARVETDYWLAECALRGGEAADALATVERALATELASGGLYLARLYRLRALCLLALDRTTDALESANVALSTARERVAPFEVAQGIAVLDACLRQRGDTAHAARLAEADEILRRLGVRDLRLPLVG